MAYTKIQSPFKRNEKKHFLPEFTLMVFEYLYKVPWKVYEKIDGFNCQIHWDGENVRFSGKSNDTFFTEPQLTYLKYKFTSETFNILQLDPCYLFGEVIGPRCNGNRYNLAEPQFVLFDSYRQFTGCWQDDSFLAILGDAFEIWRSPMLFTDTLEHCVIEVQNQLPGHESILLPGRKSEGYILRPFCELSANAHGRVITKLKFNDKFINEFSEGLRP